MKVNVTFFLLFVIGAVTMQAQDVLQAAFSAKEAVKEIYRQGFDSSKEITGWSVSSNSTSQNTWGLGTVHVRDLEDFSSINPDSKLSANIYYDNEVHQDETLCSPYFLLKKNTLMRIYTAFSGVWAFNGRFTIHAQRKSATTPDKLFDALLWSQENRHEFHKWLEFEFDLAEYTSETDSVRILFHYEGMGGDDVYIDDFRLCERDESGQVSIEKGSEVHFTDLSVGEPDSYLWTFEGGTPATSTEANPVIHYEQAGTFDVTLRVTKGSESHELTMPGYITVKAVAPVVDFEYPAEGYFSPYAGIFVPAGIPVTFTDQSTNYPEAWQWTFEGGTPDTSDEQNPTVTYHSSGSYELSLTATNEGGSQTIQSPEGAVKVGGDCSIWNIGSHENSEIGALNMGFYGYYAGTNWLGMTAFAEHFKKPLAPLTIDRVDVFFANATVIDPAVELTVSIMTEQDSLPGKVLASKTISTDDIAFDPSTWLPTAFVLDEPIEVDTTFFVVIEGIPNRTDENTYETDDLVIGVVRREPDAKNPSTAFHRLEVWDENDQPTGETQWYRQTDENVSLGIAPHARYPETGNVGLPETAADKPLLLQRGCEIALPNVTEGRLTCFDVQGRILFDRIYNGETIQLSGHGLRLLRLTTEGKTHQYKLIVEIEN